jgi:glycosyltransferase involved in cell wall biosynthesis
MIRVLVDARIDSNKSGGIQQALIGFAESTKFFSQSEYRFAWLLSNSNKDFLDDVLPEGSTRLYAPGSNPLKNFIVATLKKSFIGLLLLKIIRRTVFFRFQLPEMFTVAKEWNPDLIHFPTQFGFRTSLPNIYHPHDFQHLHLTELFSKETIELRNFGYGQMIQQASRVVVGNQWTLEDFRSLYPNYSDIVLNVPVFPQPLESQVLSHPLAITGNKYLFYPASFWPHKNHLNLLKSLRILIDEGFPLELWLSGANLTESAKLTELISSHNLNFNVKILGYLTPSELATTYANAFAVIMPSFFESESLPIWEAFTLGVPVITSNVTALPSQVGEAALLFDPEDPRDMVIQVARLFNDDSLRKSLISKGNERITKLTPANTANGYRYAYRRALNLVPDNHDLEWDKNGFRF